MRGSDGRGAKSPPAQGKVVAEPATYPMRVVTRLTGLTADTIRVWERRYGAVRPERTEGNARRYSSDEIRRLTLLRDAVGRGHAIGEIGALPDDELEKLSSTRDDGAPTGAGHTGRWAAILDAYLEAIERYDMRRADEILTRAAVLTSPRELALEVVAPLLREVGERWADGALTVAQEHVVSGQCQSLLGTMLRASALDAGAPRIVLAAPEGHEHDLGVLIAGVLAAGRGVVPVHLGANVPWSELMGAIRRSSAEVVLLGVSRDLDEAELRKASTEIRRLAERTEVWIGAPVGHAIAGLDDRVRVFHAFEPLDAALAHRFSRAQA